MGLRRLSHLSDVLLTLRPWVRALYRTSDRTWEENSSTLGRTSWVFIGFSGFLVLSCILLGVVIEIFLMSVMVFLRRALIFSPKTGSCQSNSPHKPLAVVNQMLLVAFIHYSENRLLSFKFHIG